MFEWIKSTSVSARFSFLWDEVRLFMNGGAKRSPYSPYSLLPFELFDVASPEDEPFGRRRVRPLIPVSSSSSSAQAP